MSTFEQQVDQVRRALLAAHRNGTDVGEMLAEAIRQAELALHETRARCYCEYDLSVRDDLNRSVPRPRPGYAKWIDGVCTGCGTPRAELFPTVNEEILTSNRPGSWEAEGVRSLIHGWHWGTRFDTNPAVSAVAS